MGQTSSSQSNRRMQAIVYLDKVEQESQRFRFRIDTPVPEVSEEKHVLVSVRAAALNPVDYKLPQLIVKGKVVGFDVAGVVVQTRSPLFKVGDAVFGNTSGAMAEFCVCEDSKITHIPTVTGEPANFAAEVHAASTPSSSSSSSSSSPSSLSSPSLALSFVEAAALPTAYLTSYQALQPAHTNFTANKKLLVLGASGGCGIAAVQLARAIALHHGADLSSSSTTTTATTSSSSPSSSTTEIVGVCSSRNADFVRQIGATSVVEYDRTSLNAVYKSAYFDGVYDAATGSGAGEDYTESGLAVLKKDNKLNRMVAINGGPAVWAKYFSGMQKLFDTTHQLLLTQHSRQDLDAILTLMGAKQSTDATTTTTTTTSTSTSSSAARSKTFAPIIDRIVPFTETGMNEAYEHLRSRRARGKIVFDLTQKQHVSTSTATEAAQPGQEQQQ